MEFNIKVPIPASFTEEAAKNLQTIYQYAETHLSAFLKIDTLDVVPKTGPLEFSIIDNGEPFIQINIDLHGILRVIGGVSYLSKTEKTIKLILVDEGASFLLFKIEDTKALFYGGLNGTEFKRFQSTESNKCFNYYRRQYRKLTMQEVSGLVNPRIKYYYDTPKEIEDPRKKRSN